VRAERRSVAQQSSPADGLLLHVWRQPLLVDATQNGQAHGRVHEEVRPFVPSELSTARYILIASLSPQPLESGRRNQPRAVPHLPKRADRQPVKRPDDHATAETAETVYL
jgi:hypothetical protein